MTMRLNPYISFKNNAREAMEFYRDVFGGELTISTFADLHASQGPDEDNLIMHSMLAIPNGLTLMASDTTSRTQHNVGDNISVSLSGEAPDEELLKQWWAKLMDGGTETMALSQAVWGDSFGMGVDRYGIGWLVNITAA